MLYRKPSTKFLLVFVVMLAVLFPLGAGPAQAAAKAKNVIVLIVDGCSAEQYTFARWFKGAPLSFDPYRVGAIKTYIADSVIADSAPAASAFATGVRTSDKFISVGPHPEHHHRRAGPARKICATGPWPRSWRAPGCSKKSTGIVATSRVTPRHAGRLSWRTRPPARNEDDIMEQAVHQGIDVVFGGGRRHLVPKEFKGRTDRRRQPLRASEKLGLSRSSKTAGACRASASGRVFGMFAHSHMDPEIDRPRLHPDQPTLAEMTRKAIEILARDQDGFFLMVEGSQVDWACHANDPAYLLSDLLAYDQAVAGRPGLRQAGRQDPGAGRVRPQHRRVFHRQLRLGRHLPPDEGRGLPRPRSARCRPPPPACGAHIEKDKTAARVKAVIKEGWAHGHHRRGGPENPVTAPHPTRTTPIIAIGEVLCPKYTYVGWTTHGHCGGDVPLLCLRPRQARRRCSTHPTSPGSAPSAMGFDLAKLNRRLFVDAAQAFAGGQVARGQVRPGQPGGEHRLPAGQTAELPVNKNLLKMGERMFAAGGGGGVRPRHRQSLHPAAGRST
ncbi:MAG: alkaline phosphatase [Desulfobacterales bacterium]|nr:alkaline phosphatase [Desulfobacterales bacterium]